MEVMGPLAKNEKREVLECSYVSKDRPHPNYLSFIVSFLTHNRSAHLSGIQLDSEVRSLPEWDSYPLVVSPVVAAYPLLFVLDCRVGTPAKGEKKQRREDVSWGEWGTGRGEVVEPGKSRHSSPSSPRTYQISSREWNPAEGRARYIPFSILFQPPFSASPVIFLSAMLLNLLFVLQQLKRTSLISTTPIPSMPQLPSSQFSFHSNREKENFSSRMRSPLAIPQVAPRASTWKSYSHIQFPSLLPRHLWSRWSDYYFQRACDLFPPNTVLWTRFST